MIEEIWKPMPIYNGIDFSDAYEISNLGNIHSIDRYVQFSNGHTQFCKGRDITPDISCQYMTAKLSKHGKIYHVWVHRAVALAFVENPNPKEFTEVNHIDSNKLNNCANNLEWCNRRYNQKYTVYKKIKDNKSTIAYCPICNKPVENEKYVYCSKECANIAQLRFITPNRKELKDLIREKPFLQISKILNARCSTISRWCKNYNLPYKKSEIKKYSDEEWEKI